MAELKDIVWVRLEEIAAGVVSRSVNLDGWEVRTADYLKPGAYEYRDGQWGLLNIGDIWGRQGQTVFMKRRITVPPEWKGQRIGLELLTGGEGLLSINGEPFHGVDDNRGYILLAAAARGDEQYDCLIELKPGGYLEYTVQEARKPYILSSARLLAVDEEMERLWYDFKVIHEAAAAQPDRLLQERILLSMKESLHGVDFRDRSVPSFKDDLRQAADTLKEELSRISFGDSSGKVFFSGHSHIDVAWLWPLKETARKVGRTYSTVMALMDEYQDYHFVCSQVPLFLYLKENFPTVYAKVKQRIEEGRFEPVGGTWVENDCNLISGESLVRQCLYAQRFFKEEFGVDVRVGWLPDVFGFSWAMPQIYRKSGLDYFMTSKISWNDTNRFPYNTFWWQGIDGTRIFTQLIHGTYNAAVKPEEICRLWDSYNSKTKCPEFISSYGYGDGGGGPTREMLEYLPRLTDIPGLPKARTGRVHDHFDRIAGETKDLPVWNDELYLELHRGTYTSQAWNKRFNRKSELLYREAEMYGSVAAFLGRKACYPAEELRNGWQTILLNQFHDIIPGSSINEVYIDSRMQYESIIGAGERLRREAQESIAAGLDTQGEGTPVVVFNSLSWERSGVVNVEVDLSGNKKVLDADGAEVPSQMSQGRLIFMADRLPSCGCAVYHLVEDSGTATSPFTVDGGRISTPFYDMEIASDGTVTCLYDRTAAREVLPENTRANLLQIFEDKPSNWEAWDIELQYQDKAWEFIAAKPIQTIENGPVRLVLRQELKYGNSSIEQDIILYAHSPRVDFVNRADWQERKTLLKVAFPVEVHSPKATYEIAYGAIERPTHWNTGRDKARFEVSGHRWADLSEAGYGVSLLNDSKYGWDIKDNIIRLSLLRSPEDPDPAADRGKHTFTYALLPHVGDWRNSTLQAAHELNSPLTALVTDKHVGTSGKSRSFFKVSRPGIVVDAVKQAEDGKDIIVRLYEAYGSRGPVVLALDRDIANACECDLLERCTGAADCNGREIRLNIKPFEIRTFRVEMEKR
ncbi:MAG: alpha-mannosidase [bacterium]|nr:alpha-mannosidase [bacterium]